MPTLLPQLDNDSILLMYLAGELPAEDVAVVERMLASDAALRATLEELRSAYDGAAEVIAAADARERLALPAASAARRVGQAARAWSARRLANPPAGRSVGGAGRSLRFPWWCYPLASAAAMVLAAVSWWGFQPDTGPAQKYLAPVDSGLVIDDGDGDSDAWPDDPMAVAWENYLAVSGSDDPAEVRLDEAEDELFALLEPNGDDDASGIFYGGETDEQ